MVGKDIEIGEGAKAGGDWGVSVEPCKGVWADPKGIEN